MRVLRTAVDIAKQQGATLLELRWAVGFARAADAIGRDEEGLKPLRDLSASLPAEFDMANLAEARQLLPG